MFPYGAIDETEPERNIIIVVLFLPDSTPSQNERIEFIKSKITPFERYFFMLDKVNGKRNDTETNMIVHMLNHFGPSEVYVDAFRRKEELEREIVSRLNYNPFLLCDVKHCGNNPLVIRTHNIAKYLTNTFRDDIKYGIKQLPEEKRIYFPEIDIEPNGKLLKNGRGNYQHVIGSRH